MEKLKDKVKELRKRKKWAQEDLAREIGVSLSTVQRWEKKGGEPTRLARRELGDSSEKHDWRTKGHNGRHNLELRRTRRHTVLKNTCFT